MTALELFGCSGGMAEGFRRAGVRFDVVVDYDEDAVASYEANHGHRPIRMDVRDLLRLVEDGWRPAGALDLLVADPPCTPWSRAGKREGLADERDMLTQTCRLITLLRPRAFLIGNVPGLEDTPAWGAVQLTIGQLGRHGYCVRDFTTLDAADYGVPQRRIRPFWFGHLEGPCIRWPSPTHGNPDEARQLRIDGPAVLPWVTCRQALGHLKPAELGKPIRLRKRASPKHPDAIADGVAPTIRGGGDGHSAPQVVLTAHPDHNLSSMDAPAKTLTRNTHGDGSVLVERGGGHESHEDAPARTVTARDNRASTRMVRHDAHPTSKADAPAWTLTAEGGRAGKPASVVEDWPWDRPATTVCVDNRIPPPGTHPRTSMMSMPNAVVLSEKAAAVLQGFPDSWVFSGATKRARWSQIGMAMPPPLAHAVAAAVVEQLERARAHAGAAA